MTSASARDTRWPGRFRCRPRSSWSRSASRTGRTGAWSPGTAGGPCSCTAGPRVTQAGERRTGAVTATIAGFARSCYRHWIPWRVHLGGAGEVRCSELACGAGRERSREAEREMSELTVGVVRQDDVGERRVALVPESVARLAALGLGTVVQEGAGAAAWFPDAEYAAAGADRGPARGRVRAGRRPGLRPSAGPRAAARGPGPARPAPAAARPGAGPGAGRGQGDRGQPGRAAPHAEPGPVDGRADLAGQRRRLQGRGARRRPVRRLLPDADDRGRHGPAGVRAGARRRRGRPAGDRHRPPARRGRHRLRRARGRPGRHRVDRRERARRSAPSLGRRRAAGTPGRSPAEEPPGSRTRWPPRSPGSTW